METIGHLGVPVVKNQTSGLLNHLGNSHLPQPPAFLLSFELACG